MRKSANKQQSQVRTIQRTVTTRNVTQDNGNIRISGKAVADFAVNAWRPFVISYKDKKNGCLENYIRVRAFKHRPVPIDQVFCTRCMLSPVAVLAIPANSAAVIVRALWKSKVSWKFFDHVYTLAKEALQLNDTMLLQWNCFHQWHKHQCYYKLCVAAQPALITTLSYSWHHGQGNLTSVMTIHM